MSEKYQQRGKGKGDKKHFTPKKGRSGGRSEKGGPAPKLTDEVRLNKYLSNAGICSRREADQLISSGVVAVNGKVITEMGYKVKPDDVVKYDGIEISPDPKRYFILNKPKSFSLRPPSSPKSKSVFNLMKKACKEPIIPMDKLDTEHKGLLVFTNDLDLIKRLNHPKHNINQIFHVQLNRPMQPDHMKQLTTEGVQADRSLIKFDKISYIENKANTEVGIEVKTSNSKIVQVALEELNYKIIMFDRVGFGSLTKKDVPRGNYRELKEKEVSYLKMI